MGLNELYKKVLLLEEELPKKVFGQDEAVRKFAEGYFNYELLADSDLKHIGPRGVYLFTGPKGVGKAYLAELAADQLGLPSGRFVLSGVADDLQCRILVGSSGHRHPKEGTLTGFARLHPNSFIIFDGIAKTHPETLAVIREILNQGIILDEYRDEEVSFQNCHIVFTSSVDYSIAVNSIQGWEVEFKEPAGEDILRIIDDQLINCFESFEKEYGIHIDSDPALAGYLSELSGVFKGSRILRAYVDSFFRNEIYKLRALIDCDGNFKPDACSNIKFCITSNGENKAIEVVMS